MRIIFTFFALISFSNNIDKPSNMVQLSCGVQCSRAALFALNIVFLLVGFTVMGFGIYIKVNGNFKSIAELYSISEALGSNTMNWVGVSMIVMGLLTACLAAFGCLGMLKKLSKVI